MGILVLCEREGETLTEASFDAIATARDLAQRLGVWSAPVVLGPNPSGFTSVLARCGSRTAYHVDLEPASEAIPQHCADALHELAERCKATAVVAPGTDWCNAVVSKIAGLDDVPFIANCRRLVPTPGSWVVTTADPLGEPDLAITLTSHTKFLSFDYPVEIAGAVTPKVVPFVPTRHQRADPGVGTFGAQPAGAEGGAAAGRWTVILCALAVFMIALELTVISVAFPKIQAHFSGSTRSTLSWIFTSYNVGVAALLLLAGWVAERFGRKRLFLIGLAVFLAGSVLSGLAPSIEFLLVGRSIQALGGAMLLPSSLALMLQSAPDSERNTAIGVWGATAGLAAALGPTFGALLVEFAGWRSVFLINAPVVVVALVFGQRLLVETRDHDAARRVDAFAVPTGAAGTGLLVYAIVSAGDLGIDNARVVAGFAGAVLLLAAFVWRSTRHEAPLFPPALAGERSFAVGVFGTGLFAIAFSAWLTMVPTFLVRIWDFSVLEAGFAVAPAPAIMTAIARPAGRVATRFGLRPVIVAGLLVAVAAIAWWNRFIGAEPSYLAGFLPGALLFGVGLGVALPMLTAAALRDVQPVQAPIAIAGVTTARQVAMAIGISGGVAIVGSGTPSLESFKLTWLLAGGLCLLAAVIVQVWYPKPVMVDLRDRAQRSVDAHA